MLKQRQKRTTNTQEKAGGPIQAYSYPLKQRKQMSYWRITSVSVVIHYTRIRG